MIIREAESRESSLLSQIAKEAKSYWGYEESELVRWQDDLTITDSSVREQPTFVVQLDEGIAGFFQLHSEGEEIELDHFWVSPGHMGQGFGKALLRHALVVAASLGYSVLHIDADPNAEGFYAACGATRVGEKAAPTSAEPSRIRPQMMLSAKAD